jgi:phenylpropionate dioxygenase-like ring-hydroxylating dioxygenase large terminal subunit
MCNFRLDNAKHANLKRPVQMIVHPIEVSSALDRLIVMARGDSGGSVRCADFLLAWWNGDEMGHFPIVHLTSVDRELAEDMMTCMAYLVQNGLHYAHHWDRRADIESLIDTWRR